jgi:LysR family transcriptional regulator, chromosome initiation inhibitor
VDDSGSVVVSKINYFNNSLAALIMRMFDYKLLEAIAMVVAEGGFDKAAKKLFITQSAVSQRVKQLENNTGQLLLTRTTPVRATATGLKLIRHYRQVHILENEINDEVSLKKETGFTSIAVGVNADSIATWFIKAVQPFLLKEKILLDIRAEDQELTHRLLRSGEVMGCVSSQKDAFQGCTVHFLGETRYRMVASPEFRDKWFADGVTFEDFSFVPALLFNRKDDLHNKFFDTIFGQRPTEIPFHYLPSTEKFVDYIVSGIAYGVLLDQQCDEQIASGKLVELFPSMVLKVDLYWHCWSFSSSLINDFSKALIRNAKILGDK